MSNQRILIQQQSDLTETVRVLSGEKIKLEKEIEDLSNQKNEIERQSHDIIASAEKFLEEAHKVSKETVDRDKDSKESRDYLTSELGKIREIKTKFEEHVQKVLSEIEDEVATCQTEVTTLSHQRDSLSTEVEVLKYQQEELDRVNDSLESEIDLRSQDKVKLEEWIRGISEEFVATSQAIKKETDELNENLRKVQVELSEQETVNESIRKELEMREMDLAERESNLMILRARYEAQIREFFPGMTIRL